MYIYICPICVCVCMHIMKTCANISDEETWDFRMFSKIEGNTAAIIRNLYDIDGDSRVR